MGCYCCSLNESFEKSNKEIVSILKSIMSCIKGLRDLEFSIGKIKYDYLSLNKNNKKENILFSVKYLM